jgi:hypothetical protein
LGSKRIIVLGPGFFAGDDPSRDASNIRHELAHDNPKMDDVIKSQGDKKALAKLSAEELRINVETFENFVGRAIQEYRKFIAENPQK